jgi:hypothetical protein
MMDLYDAADGVLNSGGEMARSVCSITQNGADACMNPAYTTEDACETKGVWDDVNDICDEIGGGQVSGGRQTNKSACEADASTWHINGYVLADPGTDCAKLGNIVEIDFKTARTTIKLGLVETDTIMKGDIAIESGAALLSMTGENGFSLQDDNIVFIPEIQFHIRNKVNTLDLITLTTSSSGSEHLNIAIPTIEVTSSTFNLEATSINVESSTISIQTLTRTDEIKLLSQPKPTTESPALSNCQATTTNGINQGTLTLNNGACVYQSYIPSGQTNARPELCTTPSGVVGDTACHWSGNRYRTDNVQSMLSIIKNKMWLKTDMDIENSRFELLSKAYIHLESEQLMEINSKVFELTATDHFKIQSYNGTDNLIHVDNTDTTGGKIYVGVPASDVFVQGITKIKDASGNVLIKTESHEIVIGAGESNIKFIDDLLYADKSTIEITPEPNFNIFNKDKTASIFKIDTSAKGQEVISMNLEFEFSSAHPFKAKTPMLQIYNNAAGGKVVFEHNQDTLTIDNDKLYFHAQEEFELISSNDLTMVGVNTRPPGTFTFMSKAPVLVFTPTIVKSFDEISSNSSCA